MMCFVGSYAQDYFYTHTAKFKVEGENLITNGDFSNSTTGWENENGADVDTEVWSVETGMGPDGENAIVSLSGAGGDGSALTKTWTLDAGMYIFSCWVKAETSLNTSITAGSANYLDVFVTNTASATKPADAVQAATVEVISEEWQQLSFPFNIEEGQMVTFVAQRLATGAMITNIAIHQTEEVFDTRKMERKIAFMESVMADENLTEGKATLTNFINTMKTRILVNEAQRDDLATMERYMESLDNYFEKFLDSNGTNLIGTTLTDWSTWSGVDYNKMTNRGTWAFEGGRWGFFPNVAFDGKNLEFNDGDGFIASAGIQTGQNALNVGVRTLAGSMDNLGAGKYLFAIEAQAVAASNRANPYGADHTIAIVGPNIYVGESNDVLENDTLNGYYWKYYYKVAEIKEGEEIKAGFHFPVLSGKTGGRYSVRNPRVYLLGISPEEVEFNRVKNAMMVQQYNLNLRLTEYPVELKDYPWEQDSLTRAIDHAQPIYDASLLIIDAEGNVLNREQVTEEETQILLDEVNALGRARSFIINQNQPVQALKDAVAAGNEALANPANANADAAKRTNLQAAVNAGQTLLDGISSVNQGEQFTAAVEAILAAKEEFEATSANRANPAEIQIKNGDFSDFAAGNNITPNGEPVKDWNWSIAAEASRWEIRDNETLEEGHGATIWRGTTVALDGKAWQTIDLPYEGLYEYRAKAYISEERIGELVAASQVIYNADETAAIDTIFTPNIRLFFGESGQPDSITVSKWYNGVKDDGTYFTRDVSGTAYSGMVYATYSVFFKKSGNTPTTVEFGLQAAENAKDAGANGFGFGMNKIFYLGKEEQYLADTKTEMDALVTEAKGIISGIDNYWVVKAQRYIDAAATATTAKDMQNIIHSLKEVLSRINGITEGLQGVYVNEPSSKKAEGIYTISSMRLSTTKNQLKPGLYIINGKKQFIQ